MFSLIIEYGNEEYGNEPGAVGEGWVGRNLRQSSQYLVNSGELL
ncbi:MAG: hypothetical protein AAFS06_06725 [Cyanobacteria bacterium J06631_12]